MLYVLERLWLDDCDVLGVCASVESAKVLAQVQKLEKLTWTFHPAAHPEWRQRWIAESEDFCTTWRITPHAVMP